MQRAKLISRGFRMPQGARVADLISSTLIISVIASFLFSLLFEEMSLNTAYGGKERTSHWEGLCTETKELLIPSGLGWKGGEKVVGFYDVSTLPKILTVSNAQLYGWG